MGYSRRRKLRGADQPQAVSWPLSSGRSAAKCREDTAVKFMDFECTNGQCWNCSPLRRCHHRLIRRSGDVDNYRKRQFWLNFSSPRLIAEVLRSNESG